MEWTGFSGIFFNDSERTSLIYHSIPGWILPVMMVAAMFFPAPALTQVIHIVYTSNLNCNLESCHCEGNTLGGMVQLINAVDTLRSEDEDLILLDSGDFFNTYTLPEANAVMTSLAASLKYDAMTPGDQEYVEELPFLQKEVEKYRLPLINCNIYLKKNSRLQFKPYEIISRKGLRIGVVGVTPPSSFDFIEDREIRVRHIYPLMEKYLAEIKSQSDLVVLLSHAGFAENMRIAEKFPDIRIIIGGHTQEKDAREHGEQMVVQAGQDGEYLGVLTLSATGRPYKITNKFIPVGPEFGEDAAARRKVDAYYRSLHEY